MIEISDGFIKKLFYYIVVIIWIFFILYIGSNIIIPFIIAIFITLFINSLTITFHKFKIPYFLSLILSIVIFASIIYTSYTILNNNIQDLVKNLPLYQSLLSSKIELLLNNLWLWNKVNIWTIISSINIQDSVSNFFNQLMTIFKWIWIIIIYVWFLLIELKFINHKLEKIINSNHKKRVFKIINSIKKNISSYFFIKTIISFITWLLSYFVYIYFDLDFPLFWAFMTFLLNFIPTVGSIIAVLLPMILSFLLFDSYISIIIMWIFLTWIQIMLWNIIEPKLMWNKLNLSPLTIILSLWFWWSLWGVAWMVLSVPIMVILNIIFAQIPSTRDFAILLSEKWDVEIHE